jgi:glycosyltransferase involved in cell wall biosynthesis
MVRKPLVCIAIPNYNYGRFIREAVDGVLAQSYPHIEVVVSDNASTDDSWQQLQIYAGHPKVRLYRQDHTIPIANHFDLVTTFSDARFMVLFSSDDVMRPLFVEKAMKMILEHPDRTLGFVAVERDVMDEHGNVRDLPPFYNCSCIVPGEKQAKVFLMGNPLVPSQILLDRKIFQPDYRRLKRVQDDPRVLERLRRRQHEYDCMGDCDTWYKLCLMADFGYVQDKLVLYREHFTGEAARHMGNLRGVFELYVMKHRLIDIARAKGNTYIPSFGEEAIRKIGSDCLKWAVLFLQHQDHRAAKRLMHMAVAIDDTLEISKTYKALSFVLSSGLERPWEAYQALLPSIGSFLRDFSYDPPEGAVVVEV